MIGFGGPHLELECHVSAFETARLLRQLAIARQGDNVMPLNETLLLLTTPLEAQIPEAKLARKRMAEEIPSARSPLAARATTGWRSIVAVAWRALRHAPERPAASTVR